MKLYRFPICAILAIAAPISMASCSPKIHIYHQDPTHRRAVVKIDNEIEDEIEFEESTSISVSRGVHYLEVLPEGKAVCPWTEDGKGWLVWADKEAVLTLLPPPPQKTSSDPQNEKDSKD